MSRIGEPVRRGQLRRWRDGSGVPFTILEVDLTKATWNCTFLKDGKICYYHEKIIMQSSEVISEITYSG